MLLILTSKEDFAADYLILKLIEHSVTYFRCNSEELANIEVTFELSAAGVIRQMSLGQKFVDLTKVNAVWYRRSISPIPSEDLTRHERTFVAGELRHLFAGLLWDPAVVWVNHIDRVQVAEHKVIQLRVARELGFMVPRTLVTKDPKKIENFIRSNPLGTIIKPIFHGLFYDGRNYRSIYTRRLGLNDLDVTALTACPVLLQGEVPRVEELRVTIIGEECFVASIMGRRGLIDWRVPGEKLRYQRGDISRELLQKCRQMLEHMGLKYGAFDFIRKPDGDVTFLEVNPTGEWAWLEDSLGFPMRDAFIALFGERR